MADSPPITRKRGKQNNGDRCSVRDRRYASNDRKGAAESERVAVDKRKKLLRAIPTSIPGVTGLLKSEAKRDLREMGEFVGMEVLDAEEIAPGATMVTPRPLTPKANHLEEKRARLARWEEDPSLIKKDMIKQREAVSRAEEKDALMKAQQEAWERWYLVLRAHLMARHRPTASWSWTAEVTTSPNTSKPATGGDASSKLPVPAAEEMETASEENGRASVVGDGEGPDGGNSRGDGNGGNMAVNNTCRTIQGEVVGSLEAAGGESAAWSCEGIEEEEEASLRELEQVVMNRAGLKGEFDMKKVIEVLTARSRQVMSARLEHADLLAQQQSHSQKQKANDNDKVKRDLDKAHPGDMALLGRWKELLRIGDLEGTGCRASNGMDDAFNEALEAEETLLRTKSASLLIPRGLDLPPSMRAPRFPTLLQQLHHQQRQQKEKEVTRSKATSRNGSSAIEMEVEDSKSGAALTAAERNARAMEFVPWVGIEGYGDGVGGGQSVPTAEAGAGTVHPDSAQTISSVKGCISDRVQWFPRSVPIEMAKSEGGYDERQSAHYVSKTSQAMDRLKKLMGETAKRQEEMELRRRQKVEEAVGLVRAVADHEKLRQEHLKRMKKLRKQLKKLEVAKRKNSYAAAAIELAGESTNDAEAREESSPSVDEGDQGSETISSYQTNPAAGPSGSAMITDANIDTIMDTAADAEPGGAPTTDVAGTPAYTPPPAPPAPPATVATGVTMATTRSRSPLIQGVLKTTPIPIPIPIKGKGKAKGKGREAGVRGGESPLGHQQHQQAARGSGREEDAVSATSSTSPTSPPSSSPCPSPSFGLEKTVGVATLREGDEALSNDGGGDRGVDGGGDRGGNKGSDRGSDREGDDSDDEKEENSGSDRKDPLADVSFEGVAESRKRALRGEAGGGVAIRVASKRRRSADVAMAMSANDYIGTGRNALASNGETPGASLLSSRDAVSQTSAAGGSKSKGNDTATGTSSGRGGKSKAKAATSGKRVSSTRLGSRGRRGGRK